MKTLSISNVRNHLPDVIDDILRTNEPVIVTRYGKPVASISSYREDMNQENAYPLRGTPITVREDFDEPTPELWQALQP